MPLNCILAKLIPAMRIYNLRDQRETSLFSKTSSFDHDFFAFKNTTTPEKGQSIGIWQRIIKLSVRCRIQLVPCKQIERQFCDRKMSWTKKNVCCNICCYCRWEYVPLNCNSYPSLKFSVGQQIVALPRKFKSIGIGSYFP